VLVTASTHLFARSAYVAELVAKSRPPAMYQLRAFVDADEIPPVDVAKRPHSAQKGFYHWALRFWAHHLGGC
jgi:hypothetical protein